MKPLNVCMISGSFEYDSEVSLSLFAAHLRESVGVSPTLIIYKDEDDAPSLKPIEDTDALVVFTRRLNTSGAALERFKAYCDAGKPIVGVRTASHAYQNWLAFDKSVLGGNYQGHYGAGPLCSVEVAESAAGHPVLEGVAPFTAFGSLYKNTPLGADTNLLLVGKTQHHEEPVAWTRTHRGGRVFYTSLGQQRDFTDAPDFLRLLTNAVMWVANRIE
jgi:type 1 glutamine amidotransferase